MIVASLLPEEKGFLHKIVASHQINNGSTRPNFCDEMVHHAYSPEFLSFFKKYHLDKDLKWYPRRFSDTRNQ